MLELSIFLGRQCWVLHQKTYKCLVLGRLNADRISHASVQFLCRLKLSSFNWTLRKQEEFADETSRACHILLR